MTAFATIPLFPLRTVLFPGGVLQLQIFELRYLEMIGRCTRAAIPFGVVQLTSGDEVHRPGTDPERFADHGTLAEIMATSEVRPGLLRIRCTGTRRFRVESRRRERNASWSAEVRLLDDDLAVRVPAHLRPTADGLGRVLEATAASPHASVAPPRGDWRLDDCGWVANRWCELLDLSLELRLRLMTLDSPLVRLELVTDLLREMPRP